MIRTLSRLATLAVLAVIGGVGVLFYRHTTASQNQIAALQVERDELKDIVGRLNAERRVADFLVADQTRIDGVQHTTLFMVEYARDGVPMPARSFEVIGDQVHLDALVIKFLPDDLTQKDPLRGHALLLLEKVYGDAQTPADAPRIDEPGQIPAIYRDADPKVGAFEQTLWKQFWQLSTDEALRTAHRVKVAHGVGVFVQPRPGRRYTVTLQADGNLTIYDASLPALFDGFFKRP